MKKERKVDYKSVPRKRHFPDGSCGIGVEKTVNPTKYSRFL